MTNNSKVVSLALAGLAAGGAIWYLLGTEQGKSMCNNLMNSAKDLGNTVKDKVSNKWSDISDQASGMADNATSNI